MSQLVFQVSWIRDFASEFDAFARQLWTTIGASPETK